MASDRIPPSPFWTGLAVCGLVAAGLQLPLVVGPGYPLGAALSALGGVALTLALVSLAPRRGPLRRQRQQIFLAATLVSLTSALLLVAAMVPEGGRLASAAVIAALASATGAASLGGAALATLADYRAWSYAGRAWRRARFLASGGAALLCLGSLIYETLRAAEAITGANDGLTALFSAGVRAGVVAVAVYAFACGARDQSALGGQPAGAWSRAPRLTALVVFLLVLAPPLTLESLRQAHHAKRAPFIALRSGGASSWRLPKVAVKQTGSWAGLEHERGVVISTEEPPSAFGEATTSSSQRVQLSLTHGDLRLLHVDRTITATFRGRQARLQGWRTHTRQVLSCPGMRAFVHDYLDPDAPRADGTKVLPYVTLIALVPGEGYDVGGTEARGLSLAEVSVAEAGGLPAILQPKEAPSGLRLSGFEVLQSPARTHTELRYLILVSGRLQPRACVDPEVRFAATHEGRSYGLKLDLESLNRGGGSHVNVTKSYERSRRYVWRGKLW